MRKATRKVRRVTPQLRVGQGLDFHRLKRGRKCIIGGVVIPHRKGLDGHSDADVLLHALVDAILGATGGADIGDLFPNTERVNKNKDSTQFVSAVWKPLYKGGWRVVNVDCSILAEEPKLRPYVGAMKGVIAALLHSSPDRVGIKATTSEKMGAIGRGEGVMASVVVLLSR